MFKYCINPREKSSKRKMISIRIILLSMIILMLGAADSRAQFDPLDSNFAISIGHFKGLPGDTVYMPIYLRNNIAGNPAIGEVGAFLFRFKYDYEATFDDLLIPIVDYTVFDTIIDTTVVPWDTAVFEVPNFKVETAGRGNGLWLFNDPARPFDSSLFIRCNNTPSTDTLSDTMVILFPPPLRNFGIQSPHIVPSGPDSSIILRVPFLVNPLAQVGDYTRIVFRDLIINNPEPIPDEFLENQLSDTAGTQFILPNKHNANWFSVDTGSADPCEGLNCQWGCTDGECNPEPDPDNNAPSIPALAQSLYQVEQGENVTFNVSASDPDAGDQVCLEAIGLPANASFTPSNPICGTDVTVTGTFSWTPSFGQEGSFSITFRAADDGNASFSRSVVVDVTKIDKDRLFTTSTYGDNPVGGVPGANPVAFPIDLASTKTVYGIQFDMTFPVDIAFLDSITVTDRTPEYVVYDNIGQYPDSIKVLAFGLNNEPIVEGTSTAILNAWYTLDSAAIPGDYWVGFYDAWESISPDPEIPSDFLEVDSGIIQVDIYGDVNLDQHIDVADVTNVVAYIIGSYGLPKRNFETADVNFDTGVNVIDLIGIVNIIFGWSVDSIPPSPIYTDDDFATLKIVHDDLLAGQYTKLNVQGEFPDDVAGVELHIDYDPEAVSFEKPERTDDADRFIMSYRDNGEGQLTVVLYTLNPWKDENQIDAGNAEVIRLPANIKTEIAAGDNSKIRISRAYLSNSDAQEIPVENDPYILPTSFKLMQNYPNPFNPTTRIEFELGSQDGALQHVKLDIFNILGQNVTTLIDDYLGNGIHEATWDAVDREGFKVATGVYLYKLTVNDKSDTKKMMLLK